MKEENGYLFSGIFIGYLLDFLLMHISFKFKAFTWLSLITLIMGLIIIYFIYPRRNKKLKEEYKDE